MAGISRRDSRLEEGRETQPALGLRRSSATIYLADILGFLYQHTHDNAYADKVRQILIEYGSLRDAYPKDYWRTRAEYRNGMPALSNFFFMPAYSRAYLRIRDSQTQYPAPFAVPTRLRLCRRPPYRNSTSPALFQRAI